MSPSTDTPVPPAPATAPRWVFFLLATAVGLLAANLYYAQPLVELIAHDFATSTATAGLVVTVTQLGYVAALILVVPLGDLVENRRLGVSVTALAVIGLTLATFATGLGWFLLASLLIGLGSVAVQIFVPFASHLASESDRGRALGTVTSGLMLGIMLARPLSSLLAETGSWHLVFAAAALAMLALMITLHRVLPTRHPAQGIHYGQLLASLPQLVRTTPLLRRRTVYQSALFGSFSLFWTVTPLELTQHFGFSQGQIAAFALAGVAGAIAAPIAGRVADHGWTRPATGVGLALTLVAFGLPFLAPVGSTTALVLLTASAVLLDFGVTGNLTMGQRALFSLGSEHRSRLNGVFMTTFYLGGAAGSALGATLYTSGGPPAAAACAGAVLAAALLYYLTEFRTRTAERPAVAPPGWHPAEYTVDQAPEAASSRGQTP
jgi:predicted MFS family arabinose efflux permease